MVEDRTLAELGRVVDRIEAAIVPLVSREIFDLELRGIRETATRLRAALDAEVEEREKQQEVAEQQRREDRRQIRSAWIAVLVAVIAAVATVAGSWIGAR